MQPRHAARPAAPDGERLKRHAVGGHLKAAPSSIALTTRHYFMINATWSRVSLSMWCGRRDSNPHTHRARDFKSRASTNFATSACRHRSRRRAAWSSRELKEKGRHASKSRDVGQALRACLRRVLVQARLEPGRLSSGNVEPDAHFLAGLEIGDALGVDFHYFARSRVATSARTARTR